MSKTLVFDKNEVLTKNLFGGFGRGRRRRSTLGTKVDGEEKEAKVRS